MLTMKQIVKKLPFAVKLKRALFNPLPRGAAVYSVDWFTNNIAPWSQFLNHLRGKPNLKFIEIGSYEGRSTRWLLDNILTNSSSRLICIDTLEGSMEHKEDSVDMTEVARYFYHNIRPYRRRVKVIREYSQEAIRKRPGLFKPESFDFIYIDGSHTACDVLEDGIRCFKILKRGGIMVFDDYEWHRYEQPELNPQLAIDSWLACFKGQYELIHKGYQLAIKKL